MTGLLRGGRSLCYSPTAQNHEVPDSVPALRRTLNTQDERGIRDEHTFTLLQSDQPTTAIMSSHCKFAVR